MNLIFKVRTSILNIREQPALTAKIIKQVSGGAFIKSPAERSPKLASHYLWREVVGGGWFAVGQVDANNELILCNQLAVFHDVESVPSNPYQVTHTELFNNGQLFSWRQVDIANNSTWLVQAH